MKRRLLITLTPGRSHPFGKLLSLLGRDVQKIDNDPKLQLRIHTFGFWYWTANFPIVSYLFFFQQALWLKYGLFITLIYSIYANWTSDYTGMSSSQSVINTQSVEVTDSEVTINEVKEPEK